MYFHLTTHSAYSLQEGLATPADLVQAAQANGMSALGLTDHNLLTGSIEFVAACKRAGIQPILGLEIDLADERIQVLATSMAGWSNLCRLSSAVNLGGSQICSLETLAKYSNGLIALSNVQAAELKNIFQDRLYVALRRPSEAQSLSEFARRLNMPTVVAHPVYYLSPQQSRLQKTLAAIRLNQPLGEVPASAFAPADSYFMSAREIEAHFKDYPQALHATVEIAECCKFDLPIGQANMPTVPLPDGVSAAQFLKEKAYAGAKNLYGEITPNVQTRLDHELSVIAKAGFEPIFLIVEDILNFARETGVPYSSRGSAASSLVAHCLGITSPDPLRVNLYFERFLNPARVTPPAAPRGAWGGVDPAA